MLSRTALLSREESSVEIGRLDEGCVAGCVSFGLGKSTKNRTLGDFSDLRTPRGLSFMDMSENNSRCAPKMALSNAHLLKVSTN
jgi:hypothetical protein